MPELFDPSLDEMIREIEREIVLRRSVYPGLVVRKRLTQARADRQILIIQFVLANLREQVR